MYHIGTRKIFSFQLCILVSIACLVNSKALCQNEGDVAVFGAYVGLDFNFSPPHVFPANTSCLADEGTASISGKDGELLFYTNGDKVWNKDHELMSNGEFISGGAYSTSSTQVVIVPVPKRPFLYYIFTTQFQGRELFYSLVDMELNNGRGRVVSKNNTIYNAASEKLAVIEDNSGGGVWLVTHEYGTDRFKTFHITETGLNQNPVESDVGAVHAVNIQTRNGYQFYNTNAIGYLKRSPNGNQLACAIDGELGILEVFQFNKTTGKISDPIRLADSRDDGSYGVEFSPDGSKLYQTRSNSAALYQYDLKAGSVVDIINSARLIATGVRGALQLAPDGKIYAIGEYYHTYLDVIHDPNRPDTLCNYEKDAIDLNGLIAGIGLPEMKYYVIEPDILTSNLCVNDETQFDLRSKNGIAGVTWNFDDPNSGADNFSTLLSPVHTYQSAGVYVVTALVNFDNGGSKTYRQTIEVLALPAIDLGEDTTLCDGNALNFYFGSQYEYEWQDGSRAARYRVSKAGKYWVTAHDTYCVSSDTLWVATLNKPSFDLLDIILCKGDSIDIVVNKPETVYFWNDGFTGGMRTLTEKGSYVLTGENGCGIHSDEIVVDFFPKLSVDLGEDLILCYGEEVVLDAFSESANYLWSNQSWNPSVTVAEEGVYWVNVFNRCESLTDTVNIQYLDAEDLLFPNVITPNNDQLNDTFVIPSELQGSPIAIYNRWGDHVYGSEDYRNNWGGENLEEGTYYYRLGKKCLNKEINGWVQLLRSQK